MRTFRRVIRAILIAVYLNGHHLPFSRNRLHTLIVPSRARGPRAEIRQKGLLAIF